MSSANVVLLTVDCLRADRVGCYGYDTATSPNIDALAENGVRYENCFSTGPRTNESFPGIVSSALSTDCGYLGEAWHRTPPKPTLGSWLRSAGYDTAARLANPQLIAAKGYDTGIDDFRNLRLSDPRKLIDGADTKSPESDRRLLERVGSRVHDFRGNVREANTVPRWLFHTPAFVLYREYQRQTDWPTVDGRTVATALNATLRTATALDEHPLFRWAHFNDVHAPIHPDRVNASGIGEVSRATQYLADIERLRQEDSETYSRMYDAMVRYVDARIGEVIETLHDEQLWDDTIIIVTGDHGEALCDRGVYGHASGHDRYVYDDSRDYMFNELLRVPLVVGGGALDTTVDIDAPFSTAWIHELIDHLTGVSSDGFVRGSGIDDPLSEDEPRTVVSDALTPKGHTFSVVSGNRKLITKSLSPGEDVCSHALVFDLQNDPLERSSLGSSGIRPEIEQAVEGNVRDIRDLPRSRNRERVSREAKDHLSQMGYIE